MKELPFDVAQLSADVASCWNQAGCILSDVEKKYPAALTAFAEAIRLQPDEAMYHRNHASTNIDLGEFDAAEASLKRATEPDPSHPRLAELRQELESARKKASENKPEPSG